MLKQLQVADRKMLAMPYAYALLLTILILWSLIRFEEYLSHIGGYFGAETTGTTVVAVLMVGMAVFSMPFLLQLKLSPLVRVGSALLVVATPVTWAVSTTTFDPVTLLLNAGFIAGGFLSFWILGGIKLLNIK